MKRTLAAILTLLMVLSLTPAVRAGAAPRETEEAAGTESAALMDGDLDINAVPALPYNTMTTVTQTAEKYSEYVKFTPSVSGAYTVYTSAAEINVSVLRWDGTEGKSFTSGRYFVDQGDLRCLPMKAGETYLLSPWISEGESMKLRIVSFADELKQAKAGNLPVLTGAEEGVEVSYTGAQDSCAAIFVPAVTGRYRVGVNNGNVTQLLCGEENVFLEKSGYSYIEADLIAGEEYLLYVRSKSGAPTDDKVSAAPLPVNTTDYPVARTEEEIAAELAAGPVRYTVLILDDDNEDGLNGETVIVDDQKRVAEELCRELAAAPGTNYVAVVSMGWYGGGFSGHQTTAVITDTTFSTGLTFTSDPDTLQSAIGLISGSCTQGCDISGALDIAARLLDPVRDAYGGAVETNIVLLTDGGNQYASYMAKSYKGRYTCDPGATEEWASPSWASACYTTARFVGAKHPIYVANINPAHGFGNVSYGSFWSISDQTRAFLARFLEDISTGEGRYFELYDEVNTKQSGLVYILKPSVGTKVAAAVLGQALDDTELVTARLTGTELTVKTSADVPKDAKLMVAAYDGSGRLIRCLAADAASVDTVTVPKAETYKVFLVSKESKPLMEALTDQDLR